MGIEDNTETVVKKNEELVGLRQAQEARNQEVEGARAAQAKARTAVMQKEKGIKKAEKALEAKVRQMFIIRLILKYPSFRDPNLWLRKHRLSMRLAK